MERPTMKTKNTVDDASDGAILRRSFLQQVARIGTLFAGTSALSGLSIDPASGEEVSPSQVSSVANIGICVANMESSTRFYVGALGFTKGRGAEFGPEVAKLLGLDAKMKMHTQFVSRDSLNIELLQFPLPGYQGVAKARAMNQLGLTHLSVRVKNLDRAAEDVRKFGGSLLEETRTRLGPPGAGGATIMFCTDPDGVRIELVEVKA
jgi:catechol 2,3-dioxygenase-like lactoylglutathione lyase family enzyme